MEIKVGIGIDELIFGMNRQEAEDILGKPDKEIIDEDDDKELILQFNDRKLRLSFYMNESGRLGYIRCSSGKLTYKSQQLIGKSESTVLDLFKKDLNGLWEVEEYQSFTVHSNDDYWISFNTEYGAVTQVEFGVTFLNDDEYNWPHRENSHSSFMFVSSKT